MRIPSTLLSLTLLLCVAPASGSPQTGLGAGAASRLRSGDATTLHLPTGAVTLRARPNPILASGVVPVSIAGGQERPAPVPPVTTYVGSLAEVPGAVVRLTLTDAVAGLVILPDGATFELRGRGDGGADLVPPSALMHEAIGEDGLDVPAHIAPPPPPPSPEGAAGRLRLRIALEGDYQFWLQNGDAWATRLLEVVNYVEGVYDPQIDVEFEVTWTGVWTTIDPYFASNHACANPAQPSIGKLERLAGYWQQNRAGIARDTVHLGVGQISGAFIGCAYINALNSYGYGVSRVLAAPTSLYDNVNLVSHEIGHNFGGLHQRSVGRYGLTGSGTHPPYTIMNPTAVNGILRFSDLTGVHSPTTGWELDNARYMRAHAEERLQPL